MGIVPAGVLGGGRALPSVVPQGEAVRRDGVAGAFPSIVLARQYVIVGHPPVTILGSAREVDGYAGGWGGSQVPAYRG